MQGLPDADNFSFKDLFIPLTTAKVITIIIIVGLIVYANMLFNGFVWDDKTYLFTSVTTNGLNVIKLFSANVFNSYGYYRPIPATYFSLIYSLFGTITFFYHVPQLILHITNSILFYFLLKSFIDKKLSLFLALLFLVHPIQVESVSYIAQTASVLFFFFGIIAMLLSQQSIPTRKNLIITFILLLLSLLTKEAGIAFIPLILIYRYLFEKGYFVTYGLLSLLTIGTYAVFRFLIGDVYFYKMVYVPISQLSFSTRLLNIPQILIYYIKTFLFPINLSIMQSWVVTNATSTQFYLPFILSIFLFIFLIFIGKKIHKNKSDFNAFVFFGLWFLFGICFYLQIIPLDETVADRWFYFPLAGLLGMIGIIMQATFLKKPKLQLITYVILSLIIGLFSIRTMIRNTDWQNPIMLYSHDAKVQDNYNIEANWGYEYLSQKEFGKALPHIKKSVEMLPSDQTVSQLGYIYEREGNLKLAKKYYLESLNTVSPVSGGHQEIVYEDLGRYEIYFDNNPQLANKYIMQGLTEYPNDIMLWMLLVQDESELKNHQVALAAIQKAYSLLPNENIKTIYLLVSSNQPITIPLWTFY